MKKNIGLWQTVGFAVTSLGGTLLHFLYDWCGKSVAAALFSAVNESTWEHMKLLFWPTFVFAVVQRRFFQDRTDFWQIKRKGILLGLVLIPILFYTYNGVIGPSPDWFNITIFFISAAVAYRHEAKLFCAETSMRSSFPASLAFLCVVAALFALFSFVTPKLGIFCDPLSGTYGIV